jgi:uncharacterized protein
VAWHRRSPILEREANDFMAETQESTHPPTEERVVLDGPTGRLEARLRPIDPAAELRGAALLCHPHPLYGGSLANKTLYRLAKRLAGEARVIALRLNFRGVGASEGRYDEGRGEIEDAAVGLRYLQQRARQVPHFAIGFSFGAAVGLRSAAREAGVRALVALGLPIRREWDLQFLMRTNKPLLIVQGEHDEFGRPDRVRDFLDARTAPTRIDIIEDSGHLFVGHEDEAVAAVISYILALNSNPAE